MVRSGVAAAAVEAVNAITMSTRVDSEANFAKQLAWLAMAITREK